MTRVVRSAAAFCAAGVLMASIALAQPDPAHSRIVNGGKLTLVGSSGAGPAPGFDLEIIVRDANNDPVGGAIVMIDFTGCPDINISCDQLSTTQNYVSVHKVQGMADLITGEFTFKSLQGAGPLCTTTCPPGPNVACAVVTANGVPLGNVRVAAQDINRSGSPTNAVNVSSDVSRVKQDQLDAGLGGPSYARDDYDFNGVVSINDVAIELQYALNLTSLNTEHAGWSTWPTAGTPSGFCP